MYINTLQLVNSYLNALTYIGIHPECLHSFKKTRLTGSHGCELAAG